MTSTTTNNLQVLSLNCWGLKYISKHRTQRLGHIGDVIANSTYDIVGLQECWAYADYLNIRSKTQHVLPYGKYYFSGSIGGGLVILSKWPIEESTMYRYPLNGRPTAFFRGDFYVGKGVASALIGMPDGKKIEVFCTHLHAPYEAVDSYLTHRTAQAWEISKLLRGSVQKGHITIGLGDFNMIPASLAHRLILTNGRVADSWLSFNPTTSTTPSPSFTPTQNIEKLGITCDSQLNTWRHNPEHTPGTDPHAKRLDYIFHAPSTSTVTSARVVFTDPVPGLNCSASDHFGIHITLSLTPAPPLQDTLPLELYDDILTMTDEYMKREYRQRNLRIGHFFTMLVGNIGLLIGQWWVKPAWGTFVIMLASWLWGMYATVDGLIGFVFMGSEIRALREFRGEIVRRKEMLEREAQANNGITNGV